MSTEIRPVTEGEAGTFLRLLCEVFELDFERATTVFFTEPLFDLSHKWALFENGIIRSVLTTTPIPFGWGETVGIAGVATDPRFRSQGLARRLLQHVLAASTERGYVGAMLFATSESVYSEVGFQTTDTVIEAPIILSEEIHDPVSMPRDEVKEKYMEWAMKDAARVQRTDQRWAYWSWRQAVIEKLEEGYICLEGSTIREALLEPAPKSLPIGVKCSWVGLKSMTEALQMPIGPERETLKLMTIGLPKRPQMFMTDQF
jgi:GNAT superfamily N-acetyltransferase